MKKLYLTGIQPTGEVHLGNYIGAIKPAVELQNKDAIFLYFIADYHALNSMDSENRRFLKEYTRKILASYIACGLDPNKVNLYKQSDISEIFELQTILANFTPKGFLNTSHAYKTRVDKNIRYGREEDYQLNIGLFNYPLLMAADILAFNTDYVPVGEDQVQHIEIARDIARRFNHSVKNILKEPEAIFKKNGDGKLVGIDGAKMSKSYNNTIPLFCTEKQLEKRVKQIETDSTDRFASKPLDNNIRKIYYHFATEAQLLDFSDRLTGGMSYGEAKEELFQLLNTQISPMRDKYNELMSNPKELDKILEEGANSVRPFAKKGLDKIKKALGV